MVTVFVRVTTYAATGRTYVHITVGNNVRIGTGGTYVPYP